MPCQCAPPPPPIFDLPPPPDPSLILHLLFDEPTTSSSSSSSSSLDGVEKFQQFSAVQYCPAASSSPESVVGIFTGWWAKFQGAGADFLLPWLALSLFCLCLISSVAALALRWRRRRSRKMLRSNETILNGKSNRKRATSTKSANTSMTSPTTLPLGGGYSSSGTTSATDSPEHYCDGGGNAGHFSPRSSIETMASVTSPIDKKHKDKGGGEGGWHFQPNFFAFATNITAGQFRPNTVGASRRKMPSSIGHHHHHPHHGHFHPHSQCCSPPTSCHGIGGPFPTTTISPPRTVALRMPRHFSSHEGQFVAWRTATAENGIPPTPCSFYGFGGGGNGSELYEELGETAEDVAEAPYKWRQQQRMPPPSTRPPPPPAEHLPTLANANANGSPESSLSGANSTGSDEDAEMGGSGGSSSRRRQPNAVGGTNYYSIAANGMIGQSSNNSRTESGYGTAGRNVANGKGCQRRNDGENGGGGADGLWRINPQQIGGIKQQQLSPPPINQQIAEEGEYIERKRQKVAAMTYV